LRDDDPQPFGETAMSQEEAVARISEFIRSAPELSEIPSSTPVSELQVRHGGYDIRSAERDSNVTFPMERLREAHAEGRVGELADTYFSFPGATAQGRLRKVLPEWVERLHDQDIDLMLLVPV
jgi:D-proline reductase (dithiol) PrdB